MENLSQDLNTFNSGNSGPNNSKAKVPWWIYLILVLSILVAYLVIALDFCWWPATFCIDDSNIPTATVTPDTTGMAKFWDNRYKFQFYYPKELTIVNKEGDKEDALLDIFTVGSGADELLIKVPETKIASVYSEGNWDLKYCGQNGFRTVNSQKQITFAGRQALDIVSTSVGGDISRYYCVHNLQNQPFIIVFNPNSVIAKKILATFSFWESTPSPSLYVEWKIFRDESRGFEVQYPNSAFMDLYPPVDGPANRVFGVNESTGDGNYYFSVFAHPLRASPVSCPEAAQNFTQPYRTEGVVNIDGTDYPKCLTKRKWTDVPNGTVVVDEEALNVSFNKNGYTWEFRATRYDKPAVQKVVDQILSTFKFTK